VNEQSKSTKVWELWFQFGNGSTGRTSYLDEERAKGNFEEFATKTPKSVLKVWFVVEDGGVRSVAKGTPPDDWTTGAKPVHEDSDLHVVALHYKLAHGDTVDFSNAAPLEYETDEFKVLVHDNKAVFTMTAHYGHVTPARETVEDFARAWRIDTHLATDHLIDFVFDRADVVELSGRPDAKAIHPQGFAPKFELGKPTIGLTTYPSPPAGFVASDDAQLMHTRYLRYEAGAEPLAGMAYWCLTHVENIAGAGPKGRKRDNAADNYHFDVHVLNDLGELVSTAGGDEARKSVGLSRPFTDEERRWIKAAVKALIRRTGELEHDPIGPHPRITVGSL
jgi:hypothetical protein